jgi:hypothetical protein
VSEGTELRTSRKRIQAKAQTDPTTGQPLYDEQGQPQPVPSVDGQHQPAGPDDFAVELVVDQTDKVRSGPVYRIVPYRDSVMLPGHARDKADIYGYGKRLWRTHGDVVRKADAKLYDADAVAKIQPVTEREPDPALQRSGQNVAPTNSQLADIELWELTVLIDLPMFFESRSLPPAKKALEGPRWYVVTLHLNTQQMLRIQHDDLERARYIPLILFPRPDRATEGFSFVGHKLITTTEEHTAVRNMRADRSSLVNSAPIKRLQGALWEPSEQPFGPKAVIDVRDMREIEPVQIPDVTPAMLQWEQTCERTAERLAGVNDIASGQVSQESRTLGEVQMATEQSFVRMDLIVHRFQEAMQELGEVRHEIWKRALADQSDGLDAPPSMIAGLEGRGMSIDEFLPDKKITAQLLSGRFASRRAAAWRPLIPASADRTGCRPCKPCP